MDIISAIVHVRMSGSFVVCHDTGVHQSSKTRIGSGIVKIQVAMIDNRGIWYRQSPGITSLLETPQWHITMAPLAMGWTGELQWLFV